MVRSLGLAVNYLLVFCTSCCLQTVGPTLPDPIWGGVWGTGVWLAFHWPLSFSQILAGATMLPYSAKLTLFCLLVPLQHCTAPDDTLKSVKVFELKISTPRALSCIIKIAWLRLLPHLYIYVGRHTSRCIYPVHFIYYTKNCS